MTPEDVSTREDLARFIAELGAEVGSNRGRWENAELPRYLEALAAWVADMGGYFRNQEQVEPSEPSWSLIAQMLRAATLYE
jgi:hypothetical protein